MGMGTSVSTAVSERTAVVIEDYMFDASTAGELQPEESPSDFHDTWDLDGTDFTPEASPDDEGYWDDFENIVLNHNYEELGSEIITNGGFDTDSNWTKGTGWSISDGTASISESDAVTLAQSLGSALVSGKTYKVVYTVSGYSGSGIVKAQFTGGGTLSGTNRTSNGTHTEYLTATANHTTIRLKALSNNGGFTGNIDNFSVKQVDPNDRWTLGTGWSIEDGTLIYTGTSNSNTEQAGILTANTNYELTYTVVTASGDGTLKLFGETTSTTNNLTQTVGTHTKIFFTDGTNGTDFGFRVTSNTSGSFVIDNVTVREYAITPLDV